MLNRTRLKQAFELLGSDLAKRGLLLEIAVYGGSALMLQFDWRRNTQDVDAVATAGHDGRLLAPSLGVVALAMDLPPDWLNNAVGMFTPLHEDETFFDFAGEYPRNRPGLRVLVARPTYLLAMKLKALANLNRGDRDLDDARALAKELRIGDVHELHDLYVSIHREAPSAAVKRRLASVLE